MIGLFKVKRYSLEGQNLGRFVKFIWHLEADAIDVHHKLMPMESIDIVLNLSDEMIYETIDSRVIAPKMHVNGIRRHHSFIHHKGTIDVWGISFYAYGLYPFVHQSLEQTQNKIVDLKVWAPQLALKLKDALRQESNQSIYEGIIDSLVSELKASKECLFNTDLIQAFMASEDLPISTFCLEHEVNLRTFERLVKKVTGFSPIQLRNVRRYKIASHQLLFDKESKIHEVVYDHQYTDQAYFSKACKKFSGVSPKEIQQDKITVIKNMTIV